MATLAMRQWIKDEIRAEQVAKDADLATRIIESFAGVPNGSMSPVERNAYEAALRTMTLYFTHELLIPSAGDQCLKDAYTSASPIMKQALARGNK